MSQAPLISGWDNNDLRKRFSVYKDYLINGVLTNAEVEPGIYDLRMGKYKDPNAPIDIGNGNDLYFYRFADVLLIYAEAANKLNGPNAVAYTAINQVRRRGYGVPVTTLNASVDLPPGLTQTQFDDMVFRERSYAFLREFKRWFDMVRTGRVAQTIDAARAVISLFYSSLKLKVWLLNFIIKPKIARETTDTLNAMKNKIENEY